MTYPIRAATGADLPAFFAYLNDHLSDNGRDGTALFMPMPRSASGLPPETQAGMRNGIGIPVGQPGWRRPWLAFATDGSIAGHVDLRARPEAVSAHRALLGMGVHRDHRQQGLGAQLVGVAAAWARDQKIAWIDLDVLSANAPAIALYARCGFTRTGEMADLFRIDGTSLAHTFMTRKI
ncbi:GNAT family N-acetyltransferase [Massilia sp. TSP1-1-2]|uniref:GNAT family N-acetyltransferase n=1 Tax=unclassified Massilia TaxID=2609279 RepID=UPI003CF34EDF